MRGSYHERSLAGVIERLDRRRFEVVIFCSPAGAARIGGRLPSSREEIVPLPGQSFAGIIDTIAAARCDLLYYWEVGVDWVSYFSPYHRLAPIQCTSWGIQVTSGIPAIDYYLSSALVEPEGEQDHYSETLLCASTLLTYRERLELPERTKKDIPGRAALGLGESAHVYACPQNVGKIQPEFDGVLAAILRRDPAGVVALTGHVNPAVNDRLRQRLDRALGDLSDRLVIFPRLEHTRYLGLLQAADVMLDPLFFGGVNTTYDALSHGIPIVTLPGRFHRGRYTLGCYKKMGVFGCVAASVEEYVEIAVRLGSDPALREATQARLLAASGALFEDLEAVREHERLFDVMLARTPAV